MTSFEHIFEKSLQSLSPCKHIQTLDHPNSFTQIFGQLEDHHALDHNHKLSISSMNSECISTCTEELSSDDNDDWKPAEEVTRKCRDNNYDRYWSDSRRCSSKNLGLSSFPPPISCIGRNGKPWVFFKSIRKDGRFILKEIRIPTQEFLHACRKNGRLKMHFVQSDDEILDDDDEEEEEDDDANYGYLSEIEDGA